MDGLEIVIVAWRSEEMLRRCLSSLREHAPGRPTKIRVIDNASPDGTAAMVGREFPEIELTVNSRNLGFGAANNLALRELEAEYVLLLNPDTEVPAGALESMLELMEAHPKVGIAGPRLEQADGSFDHASRRSFPTPLSALGHFTGIGRRLSSGKLAEYRAPGVERGPVDAVNGAFMLIRATALRDVGLFDERYWMYMEDLDLCYRFAQAGWTTWFEPSVTVRHIKAGTSGKHRSLRLNYAFHYGMFRFYRDHCAAARNPVVNGIVYVGITARFLWSALTSAIGRAGERLRPSAAPQA